VGGQLGGVVGRRRAGRVPLRHATLKQRISTLKGQISGLLAQAKALDARAAAM